MDEDFIDVQGGNSKLIAFVLIVVMISISMFGYFFVYQRHYFGLKNITVELGSELTTDVNYYLKKSVVDTSGYKLNISKVDTMSVGTYEYSITFNKKKKSAKIKVEDTVPPKFSLVDKYIVEVGDDDFFLGDVLKTCEDASMPCIVTFQKDSDESLINSVGEYDVAIYVSDVYKNKVPTKIHMSVVEKGSIVKEEEADLEYASASSELPNFNDEYYLKLTKALKKDSEEAEDKKDEFSIELIDEYVKEKYPEKTVKSSEIVEVYNKSEYIIGYVIKIELDDGKVVYMSRNNDE